MKGYCFQVPFFFGLAHRRECEYQKIERFRNLFNQKCTKDTGDSFHSDHSALDDSVLGQPKPSI